MEQERKEQSRRKPNRLVYAQIRREQMQFAQLAASLLTTCNGLVIIKPEQAMRTHPDIGLVIADLLQLARFLLCIENIVVRMRPKATGYIN